MTKLHEIHQLGQSIWYDNISRALIDSGQLQVLIDQGVRGMTSNPTIFDKAISGSQDYDDDLRRLVEAGKSADEIYEALALDDIGRAADLLRPIYDESGGVDGYISLEVSPTLAYDTDGTIANARRLFHALGRPNVMIKVPATLQGLPAIERLIGEAININVTLMFSLEQYDAVAEAYIAGLEKLAASGGDVSKVASVASFFVSRVDGLADKALEKIGNKDLLGKIAIANAKAAYARFQVKFSGERWERLAKRGARVQRPLWASTSTKNPNYPDTIYVDTLIGPHTVNTLPPATVGAVLDHAVVAVTIDKNMDEAYAQLKKLGELGIDLRAITDQLLVEGVDSFAKSFESLLKGIADKRSRLLAEQQPFSASLGSCQAAVDTALKKMRDERIISRIWASDHTVWSPSPDEIANRLGWLTIDRVMSDNVHRMEALVETAHKEGYTCALLLGMGGSSLAPEVFRKTFGVGNSGLDLAVLDSTDPDAVLAYADRLDPAKTLYIVSTKSGGTVETFSFFKFFYNRVAQAVGRENAGKHFVAITDPGSGLADTAERYQFRATFLNDPNIGGRYSALSYFGLVPAALVGVDVARLLERAHAVSAAAEANIPVDKNDAAVLGAILGELAKAGRDKVTLVMSPAVVSFGDWVEQLIAESTGKNGRGILPVVGEPLAKPEVYGNDRLFVYLRLAGDSTHDAAVDALEKAGHPVVRVRLHDIYDLGGQFFLWELATAVAGHVIGIQPFDQPNVESAKVLARKMVAAYTETGQLPSQKAALTDHGISVYADGLRAANSGEALQHFVRQARPGGYIALQAYVQPTPETDAALLALRTRLRDSMKLATTVGYGPRFLHSTGQLHKGDSGQGLFIQFTSDPVRDANIPDEAGKPESSMTFGVLKMAQALGDGQALLDSGRKVIRFHLGKDVIGGLKKLANAL